MKLPRLIEVIRGQSDWEYKMFKTCKENTRPQTKGVRTKGSRITRVDLGDIRPDIHRDLWDSQAIGRVIRECMDEMLRDFRQSRGTSVILSDVHFPITNLEP